ncbi:MAG: 3' terminal RNA ribose 2'-O-methyltransferase Hen1 [Alphaproteobacteria bacterium]|nr:3' terminal RNA ribose 2'-O-methyltransferase Hen1 [Alphaproteobacteria bacterium]
MLLTVTTTHRPATDLGFLLMKNPARVHEAELPFGRATIFFPEAGEDRCTAALTVEVDPVELVRGKGRGGGIEEQYVTDRPYAASSLLSVAIGRALGTAMSGRSRDRQALADSPLPLAARIDPLPLRGGGEALVRRLFEPLGYAVAAAPVPLDPAHPEWGDSPYAAVTLSGETRLAALLTHLFVLIPVLDDSKHYYVGEDEVAKLLRKGEGWLESHPERELIVRRYLGGFRSLVRAAGAALDERVETEAADEAEAGDSAEEAIEKPIRLNDLRIDKVVETLKALGATSVLDLGCGEGRLLRRLLAERQFGRIVGVEVAPRILAAAGDRLRLERMADLQRKRIALLQGSLVYRDERLMGFDAAAVIEVIEHMEPDRLPAFEAALFGHARPGAIVLTTPNRDYNACFESMAEGAMRHPDHRFEWTRGEFEHWALGVASAHGYEVRFEGIGAADPARGAPTQMGVFTRC